MVVCRGGAGFAGSAGSDDGTDPGHGGGWALWTVG